MKIIYGRSGYGKTNFAMNEIKKCLEDSYDGNLFYIVPDNLIEDAEIRLSNIIKHGGIINVEVLTLKRLCKKIYGEFDIKKEILDAPTKSMLLYYIMSQNEDKLKILKGASKNLGLVATVSDMISEFKRYNVSIEGLKNLKSENEYLKMKLADLIFLYEEFEKKTNGIYIDSDDEYSKILDFIKDSKMLKNAKIWIDGFDYFTPQEINVVNELEKVSYVSVLLTFDGSDNNMFLQSQKTYEKLKNPNDVESIYLDKQKRFNNIELSHLEKNFNSSCIKKYEEKTQCISVQIERNPDEEIENIARTILKKVREENYRYEDIAIITGNAETYKNSFKTIFGKYNIPYYFDEKQDFSAQPLMILILMILDICTQNYSYESIFNYLKTGLTNIEDINDIDILENYVLEWGITGETWLNEWNFGKKNLTKVNFLREKIIEPIEELKENIINPKKISEFSNNLYNFLIKIKVYSNIQNKINFVRKDLKEEDIKITNLYINTWNALINLLDEIVMALGDEIVTFEMFKNILKQGILKTKLSNKKNARDHIIIDDVVKKSNIKTLFVIGLNDGVFPKPHNDEGFINDSERFELLESGIELEKDTKSLLVEENFNIYKILVATTEELNISYPISDINGKALRPSEVINSLKRIFPNLKVCSDILEEATLYENVFTVDSSLPILLKSMRQELDGEGKNEDWKKLYLWFNENAKEKISYIEESLNYKNTVKFIKKENAEKLYGNEMNTSVSKLETFSNCPFKFYLQYGLNAKERKTYKLDTPDVGIFLHEIIEKFSNYLLENKISFKEIAKEQSDEIVSNIVDDVLSDFKAKIMTSNSKMKQLSSKLKRLIKRVIWIMVLQIKESEFEVFANEIEFGKDKSLKPIEIELDNGKKVLLNGKIDRVDIAKMSEGKYTRIIDYKSYSKEMKLFNIYAGLELQLITYIDALEELSFIPGGILYLKLEEPMVKTKKDVLKEDVEEELRKSLRMNGMILADENLIKAMDTEMVSESNNLNLKISKEKYTGKTYVVEKEDFEILRKHVRGMLKILCEDILSGSIENRPTKLKGKIPCDYCAYKDICRFDKELGDNFKTLFELKKEEIWENLRQNYI